MKNTKRVLAKALKSLLEKKPITKISISEITDSCGVSRMTFYYHFKDIYDLLDWISEEDMLSALPPGKEYATWRELCVAMMTAMRANRSYMTNVYLSLDTGELQRYILHMTERFLANFFGGGHSADSPEGNDQRYALSFEKYGFTGLIISWVRNDMKEEPAVIVEQVISGLKKQLLDQ